MLPTIRRARSRTRSIRALSFTPCGHPLINMKKLRRKSDEDDALRAALIEYGYFYAAGVQELSAGYIASIYEYSVAAHKLPPDVKMKYAQRGGTGVYSGPDIGQLELQYEADGIAARVCGWDYSRTRFTLGDTRAEGDDRYPSAEELTPYFPHVLDELYARQDALARVLLGGFERALELPAATLIDMFQGEEGGDFGTIRLLQYPGDGSTGGEDGAGGLVASLSETTGIGAHTDFECFTLMHQNAPGLQLMPRLKSSSGGDDGGSSSGSSDVDGGTFCGHGDWIEAPVRPSEFVVIIGDMLERLTNGVLLATPHRVLPTPHPRASIIRFNAFGPRTVVAPLDAFVTPDRPPRYSPVRMQQHMETTMTNLAAGLGSWDARARRSRSATYEYEALDR